MNQLSKWINLMFVGIGFFSTSFADDRQFFCQETFRAANVKLVENLSGTPPRGKGQVLERDEALQQIQALLSRWTSSPGSSRSPIFLQLHGGIASGKTFIAQQIGKYFQKTANADYRHINLSELLGKIPREERQEFGRVREVLVSAINEVQKENAGLRVLVLDELNSSPFFNPLALELVNENNLRSLSLPFVDLRNTIVIATSLEGIPKESESLAHSIFGRFFGGVIEISTSKFDSYKRPGSKDQETPYRGDDGSNFPFRN